MNHRAALAFAACVLASVLAACGGGPGGSSTGSTYNLALTGTLSSAGTDRTGPPCTWAPAAYNLTLDAALAGGDIVSFNLTVPLQAVGDMDAASPAATGGTTALWLVHNGQKINARSGAVHITDAQVGKRTFKGSVEGVFDDGTNVSGTWSCSAGI